MIFREIIRLISGARLPIDIELVLSDLVLDPIQTHIHGLQLMLFDLLSTRAQEGWLEVSNFLKGSAKRYGILNRALFLASEAKDMTCCMMVDVFKRMLVFLSG